MSVAKRLVSKKKKRYTEDGFDLDLSYILPNVIAMGFPADHFEGVYRNHIDDVSRFLKMKHDGHYLVYNLCSEKQPNESKLENRVVRFPFDDHNAPTFSLMYNFCSHAKAYIDEDERNTVVVHCKAGKGRTGVMICCLLMFLKLFPDAVASMEYYGNMRTYDGKGVTIPSQQRYIHYFHKYLHSFDENDVYTLDKYIPKALHFDLLIYDGYNCNKDAFELMIKTYHDHSCIYKSPWISEVFPKDASFSIIKIIPLLLCGDIMFELYSRNKRNKIKTKMVGKFWINTFFLNENHKLETCNASSDQDFKETMANDLNQNYGINSKEYSWTVLRKQDIDKLKKDVSNKEVPGEFRIILGMKNKPGNVLGASHKEPSVLYSFDKKAKRKKNTTMFNSFMSFFDKANNTNKRIANSHSPRLENKTSLRFSKKLASYKSIKRKNKLEFNENLKHSKPKKEKKVARSALNLTPTSPQLNVVSEQTNVHVKTKVHLPAESEYGSLDIDQITWCNICDVKRGSLQQEGNIQPSTICYPCKKDLSYPVSHDEMKNEVLIRSHSRSLIQYYSEASRNKRQCIYESVDSASSEKDKILKDSLK